MVNARRSIVVVNDFYDRPDAVRNYALNQRFYLPYENESDVQKGLRKPTWWASEFRDYADCPFKSSPRIVSALEAAVGERVDLDHWRASYPVDSSSKPLRPKDLNHGCLWNCSFHVKPDNGQKLGDGVHNHVTDSWNSVGVNGWAGILYLNDDAPVQGGLSLWKNNDPEKNFDWMTPAQNWTLVDSFGNIFNRLLLVRGDIPHSGSRGWADSVEKGRMFQTFFFRTSYERSVWPVPVEALQLR